jgi:hypothetical protein
MKESIDCSQNQLPLFLVGWAIKISRNDPSSTILPRHSSLEDYIMKWSSLGTQ